MRARSESSSPRTSRFSNLAFGSSTLARRLAVRRWISWALDAKGSLALIAVGPTADAKMFLRTVDVYWWCREHPDIVRRLFPAARVSPDQPPRILFAAQRFARFFLRSIEEVGFADVRCVNLLNLEVNGVAAGPPGAPSAAHGVLVR